jgi:hypothetical protein
VSVEPTRFLLCAETGARATQPHGGECPVHGGDACLRVFVPAPDLTDPRELGGDIAGPGGPYDHGAFVIDSRRAILMDALDVVKVDHQSNADALALLVQGRINKSTDRARVMVLGDLDLAAAFITQLHGLAHRMGRQDELHRLCAERWERMP